MIHGYCKRPLLSAHHSVSSQILRRTFESQPQFSEGNFKMKSKGGDSHSTNSSETAALQKLGFDAQMNVQTMFASTVNRVKPSSAILSIIFEIVSFIQIISISFYSTIDGLLSGSRYTYFLARSFRVAMNLAHLFPDIKFGHIYAMIIYMIILAFWVIFFVAFAIRYKRTKTFSPVVVKVTYYIGYYIFGIIQVVCATTVGFFTRALVTRDTSVNPIGALFSIVFFVGYYVISLFMLRSLQSSPDVDIKNKMAQWPQDSAPRWYRMTIGYFLPFLMELARGWSDSSEFTMFGVIVLVGIGGLIVCWHKDSNVFPIGRVVSSLEYVALLLGPILSVLYRLLGGSSLWYLLVFAVLMVVIGVVLNIFVSYLIRVRIDLLYSKFENLTANITTPKQCITLLRTGIVFNVPCITNHTILNWAIARWPNDQSLILMIAFLFYTMHVPYSEILELVVVAVDISPFSVYDTLLFSQIFNRLPTREHHLTKRLDGIRRLYDLPKSSLRAFWEAVLRRQWDEIVHTCRSFRRDLDYLNETFSNLLFENPSSDCVIHEFIKFSIEIQGNYAAAHAAQKELNRRQPLDDTRVTQGETECGQMSQLSNTKSSLFLSEFTETPDNFNEVHHAVQSSVQARPVFFPQRILVASIFISLVSVIIVILVFVFSTQEGRALDDQVQFASYLYRITNYLTLMFCSSIEFSTHDQNATMTVSGNEFNSTYWRSVVNRLSSAFDTVFADCFQLHPSLPPFYLRLWVGREVETVLLSPVLAKATNLTLLSALRLFQIRGRTLAFSPEDYFGSISDPCPEILSLTYLYPAVSEVTSIMMNELTAIVQDNMEGKTHLLLITALAGVAINAVLVIITLPVICIGMFRETDFILTIYGSIPNKIIKSILADDLDARDIGEDVRYDQDRNQRQKKLLPASMYQILEVIILFLAIFIITPIPAYLSYFSYKWHSMHSLFVLNGIELSSKMVTELGLMFLHSFRILTHFPSPLTAAEELKAFELATATFKETYNTLLFGQTEDFPQGLVSFDLDVSKTFNDCSSLIGGGEINHSCSSFHSDVYFVYGLGLRLVNFSKPEGMGVDSDWWRLFYPAAYSAFTFSFSNLFDEFISLSKAQRDSNHSNNLASITGAICLFLIAVIASVVLVKVRLIPSVRCLLRPILLMDPQNIADSPFLMRFLQGDYDNPSRQVSSEGKRKNTEETPMIDYILEGVLVMTADGVVVASNRKYHELMSNTADETTGVNIRQLLPSSCAAIFDAMDEVRSGGVGPHLLSLETSVFSDDDKELQVKVTFVAHLGLFDAGDRSTVCAVILTDRLELTNNQALLRKEKANVERYLNEILPQPIAKSWMNGQNDISFQVPKACVLLTNIVSFTPMCTGMSAKAVINTINGIFNEFDAQLSRFPSISKVKTIGDSYLCVSGIFDADSAIEESASDLVNMALSMQDLAVSLNAQHNTSIHLRIGVHCGGPVLCGVIGRESPIFEVFGQPLLVAEQLELTCPHDAVHASAEFAKLIENMALKLTERASDVRVQDLEGQKTFLVTR